ncbi:MAG: HAD hydrolase-like protein, partial [Candidatus Caccosoma sp.]|nr:HAD hydrolase-like protein [Candidatus Caccosoma sp.]
VYYAMEKLNVNDINKVLYVGDNTIDYDTANNAKCKCVIVKYAKRALKDYVNANYYVDNFIELLDILK